MTLKKNIQHLLIATLLLSCSKPSDKLFTDVTEETGIDFSNMLQESEQLHILNFEYMYNGGGIAVGDINNDGLQDIYFSANQQPDKLYLNKGDLKFEDITTISGTAGRPGWKTGVCMADVNGDGRTDIYVCYSGKGDKASRSNQLFINKGIRNGKPYFIDEAAEYGIDVPGSNSTQAAFFDYDRDGDLDFFLVNHATTFYSPLFNTTKLRTKRHPYFSNYLFRNDNGHFTDVSVEAGIKGGGNNFGLGLTVSDINNDGWPDIYTTNDYEEQDFLYLNNQRGGFTDVSRSALSHISKYGMGCDIADYNNDGLMDIIVADMRPEDNKRQKLLEGPDEYDKYHILVDSGYFHQNMRNTLQAGQGITSESIPVFSEIAQLAGVANTDWSWAPLFADLDNDGYKDLFFTNGYWRDYTNRDFLSFNVEEYRTRNPGKALGYDLVMEMPQTKISNYAFRNDGNLQFNKNTVAWGLDKKGVSNGAAYADLDNDGDLDLVINNLGEKSAVFRNNTKKDAANFLRVILQDTSRNSSAVGARLVLESVSGKKQYLEMSPVRGFQSSVDPVLHFGLGRDSSIKQLTITWPDGSSTIHTDVKINTTAVIKHQASATVNPISNDSSVNTVFEDISGTLGIDFIQKENLYVDFKHEYLLPWQLSRQGPKLAKADVNNDGLEDIFIGAPIGQAAVLYVQTADGKFVHASAQPWSSDSLCEDIQSLFFDADGDGDNDLYLVSGGNETHTNPEEMQDRLYLNDGKGRFSRFAGTLPASANSKSCVAAADYNKDGKIDLFVGGRLIAGKYGLNPESYLLKNISDQSGIRFTVSTVSDASALQFSGMITDAVWQDINNDDWPDLIVAGEWMPVQLFINNKGKLINMSSAWGLDGSEGLWTSIIPTDMDGDGDMDFLLGNLAPNTQLHASSNEPMTLCINDYMHNGTTLAVLNYYIQGKSYPYPSRDEMAEPLPLIKKKYLRYADYATATFQDIFSADQLKGMQERKVYTIKNSWLENKEGKKFVLKELPVAAQFSSIQAAVSINLKGAKKPGVFAAGNFYPFRVQLGRQDAGKGIILSTDESGKTIVDGYKTTGIFADGDIRDMVRLSTKTGEIIIIAKNNGSVQILKFR